MTLLHNIIGAVLHGHVGVGRVLCKHVTSKSSIEELARSELLARYSQPLKP